MHYTSRIDSFVVLHLISSLQRASMMFQDYQIQELQNAAKRLLQKPQPHIFSGDETITCNLAYLDFLFNVVFDLSTRLFCSTNQLDSVQKLMTKFAKILRPELLQQLNVQNNEDPELRFKDDEQINAEYGLNLN